ncbi:leucyl-tRNA synthetase [Rhizodiscina lignyota]|uniref:leucine--tRNA ligase n=1 Tax=Rhizodiscina lignyota TaxID=1504668 RepID=A0A9P4M177_9PEZI|nr:leucyl-tRNA synthetase [Rhizodiscina lignyota]
MAAQDVLDPSNGSKNTMKIENTEKRDTLIDIEKKYQKKWADDHVFEIDAPTTAEFPFDSITPAELHQKFPKQMVNFAFPYMNGSLHAGHAFTSSKMEFATGFARMEGKRALFPLGYHCTGMPIKACADKLIREVEMFGKNFEGYAEEELANGDANPTPAPTQDTKADITKHVTKKSKAVAKTGKMKYQFQIMQAQGVPVEEIHKFCDTDHWLQYYPPICQRDMTSIGARIDWRRSFVTTDANPYFDSFVRWQMRKLKELGKIKFGKRYTVYSPKDGQPCLDHDRSAGEGVGVQEYTALKLKVKEWPEAAQKLLSGKLPSSANVYFVPATLRPETMYGQTCCFVGPNITYGIFKVTDDEYYFCSDRAARNMAFQSVFPEWGVFPKVAELQGSDVVGTLVNAPLSVHKEVRILPMETVKATKGTGVVTSVPSDSPDDYATVMDLAKKAEYYGIKKEWAELEIIPIIETPKYGNLTAATLVKQLKIQSPKDAKPLAEAKDEAYKEGFYNGKMIYGEFKGKPVSEAKNLVRKSLIDAGDAFNYAEPDGLVISRSGDDCVAAHLDQWFLNYGTSANGGDGEWCEEVFKHLESGNINMFSSETKHQFEQVLGWLAQWACARSYGLGTKLPWDEAFLVESLSDSTIYPSYYTISHYLHSDIFGTKPGKFDIKPSQMTDEVWDYLYCRRDTVNCDIPIDQLQTMKREFQYFYPNDMRGSGKDLIQNHLTFYLYIHVALFPKEYWPRGIRANGHLLLNGEKMAKSTGNFLTLSGAVEKFGADATRIALADAGDGIDDANFEETSANAAILRLHTLKEWCEEMIHDARLVQSPEEFAKLRDAEKMKNTDVIQRTGPKNFWDELFENELNGLVKETFDNYSSTSYKAALKTGFYDFLLARDSWRSATAGASVGMHHDLVKRYIELQALMLAPIAPHWAEYIWLEVLKKPSTIQNALWPEVPATVPALTAAREYVRTTASNITSAEGMQQKKLAKGKNVDYDPNKDKRLTIYVAASFPSWQNSIIATMRDAFDGLSLDMKAVTSKVPKPELKRAMPFIQELKKRLDSKEPAKEVFERKLAFDEVEVLTAMVPYLKATVKKCLQVQVIKVEDADGGKKKKGVVVVGEGEGSPVAELPQTAEGAVPGKPGYLFANV